MHISKRYISLKPGELPLDFLQSSSSSDEFSQFFFISPFFLKDVFTDYRILGQQSFCLLFLFFLFFCFHSVLFPFTAVKMTHYLFLACVISEERSTLTFIIIPLHIMYHFSLTVFKILSLSLVFSNLIVMCLGEFSSPLSSLRFAEFFACVNQLSLNLEIFKCFFQKFFLHNFLSPFLLVFQLNICQSF